MTIKRNDMEPSDFYFNCGKGQISITPIQYFDKHGFLQTRKNVVPSKLLPPNFYELKESVYTYKGEMAEACEILLLAGFVENLDLVTDEDLTSIVYPEPETEEDGYRSDEEE